MNRFSPYAKAILGFVSPGAVIIGASVLDSSAGGSSIVAAEWVTAIVACVVTGAGVYRVENQPSAGEHRA